MENTDKLKLKEIYDHYDRLHKSIKMLESSAETLAMCRAKISKELDKTRKKEKLLINKIEESLQRKITQEDLFEIIESFKNEG